MAVGTGSVSYTHLDVYKRQEEGGVVYVTMTTTTRFCPATDFLKEAVQACVWYVPGVEYAEVKLTYEPPWTPEMMQVA